MLSMTEMMDRLDREFPDKASAMVQMDEIERIVYLAKIEMISMMKMWNETPKLKKKGK